MKKITREQILMLEAELACASPKKVAKLVKKLMRYKNNFMYQTMSVDESELP